MQGKKYETTGKARKMIGDAAWYVSLIVFLMVIFVVASVVAACSFETSDEYTEGAVMLADISSVDAIYIVCGRTDMRK